MIDPTAFSKHIVRIKLFLNAKILYLISVSKSEET